MAMREAPGSDVHQSAFVLAEQHSPERPLLEDREHLDRQFLVAAQREGGGVHHLQVATDRLVEADRAVTGRCRVLHGIGTVHPVDLGRLQDDLGADLGTAQRRRGVGGEEGVARAGREDHDLALLEVAQRLGADVGLNHLLDLERRLDPGRHARVAQRILQRQGVHDGGQHAHVVGGGTVHARGAERDPAEDVAPADHDRELGAHRHRLADLPHHARDRAAVDAVGVIPHEGLSGQLEQDALVGLGGFGHRRGLQGRM